MATPYSAKLLALGTLCCAFLAACQARSFIPCGLENSGCCSIVPSRSFCLSQSLTPCHLPSTDPHAPPNTFTYIYIPGMLDAQVAKSATFCLCIPKTECAARHGAVVVDRVDVDVFPVDRVDVDPFEREPMAKPCKVHGLFKWLSSAFSPKQPALQAGVEAREASTGQRGKRSAESVWERETRRAGGSEEVLVGGLHDEGLDRGSHSSDGSAMRDWHPVKHAGSSHQPVSIPAAGPVDQAADLAVEESLEDFLEGTDRTSIKESVRSSVNGAGRNGDAGQEGSLVAEVFAVVLQEELKHAAEEMGEMQALTSGSVSGNSVSQAETSGSVTASGTDSEGGALTKVFETLLREELQQEVKEVTEEAVDLKALSDMLQRVFPSVRAGDASVRAGDASKRAGGTGLTTGQNQAGDSSFMMGQNHAEDAGLVNGQSRLGSKPHVVTGGQSIFQSDKDEEAEMFYSDDADGLSHDSYVEESEPLHPDFYEHTVPVGSHSADDLLELMLREEQQGKAQQQERPVSMTSTSTATTTRANLPDEATTATATATATAASTTTHANMATATATSTAAATATTRSHVGTATAASSSGSSAAAADSASTGMVDSSDAKLKTMEEWVSALLLPDDDAVEDVSGMELVLDRAKPAEKRSVAPMFNDDDDTWHADGGVHHQPVTRARVASGRFSKDRSSRAQHAVEV